MECYICKEKKEWFIDEDTCMDCYDRIMDCYDRIMEE